MVTNEQLQDLREEIQIDEEKILKDEKRAKRFFWIVLFLIIVTFLNFVVIYQFIFKPEQISSKDSVLSPTPTIEPTLTETVTPTQSVTPVIIDSSVKEYFVAFGSGTSSADDWADVDGLEANVDFSSYGNVKDIIFEVSVSVPTANQLVWVRLYNKTDKHPVWNSEVSTSGSSGYTYSKSLIYDQGAKDYQVQVKTQLKYPANITQARLHIKLN